MLQQHLMKSRYLIRKRMEKGYEDIYNRTSLLLNLLEQIQSRVRQALERPHIPTPFCPEMKSVRIARALQLCYDMQQALIIAISHSSLL